MNTKYLLPTIVAILFPPYAVWMVLVGLVEFGCDWMGWKADELEKRKLLKAEADKAKAEADKVAREAAKRKALVERIKANPERYCRNGNVISLKPEFQNQAAFEALLAQDALKRTEDAKSHA